MIFSYGRHSRNEIEDAIDEYIFNERDREIVKKKLLDGKTYAILSEEYELTERRLIVIVNKAKKILTGILN